MTKVKEPQKITIVTLPISTPKEKVLECAIRDKMLINATCEYRKYLEKEGVEVYSRSENILATEKGYMCAFYDEDLRNMEVGIDNPIPFKGKDGRLKIEVVKENGEKVIQDLAQLVAMKFCDNPKKYKYVGFLDYNKENCSADNLFWCSKFRYWVANNLHF